MKEVLDNFSGQPEIYKKFRPAYPKALFDETTEFDFEELPVSKDLTINVKWDLKHLEGYLNSWSAVQNYLKETGREIYIHYPDGMERSKLKLPIEKQDTVRNINTVTKLVELIRQDSKF